MDIKIVGNKLIIEAQLSSGTRSKSGKSFLIASTNGFVRVADSDISVSLNVIKPTK